MKLVLLSGGSGKRLWPMSNDIRSKQFLRVLPVAQAAQPQSMLQRVWGQLHRCGLEPDAYVCASKAQVEMIRAQVGNVACIEEPLRRDTFPAIALSTLYLLDVVGIPDEEPVVICPVDHFVDDHYFCDLQILVKLLDESNADLALMGVKPTSPTSKFGYIVPDSTTRVNDVSYVSSFVEKPEASKAQELIRQGALWNCGVFCFRAGWIRSHLAATGRPTTYEECVEAFDTLPKRSFDYEVVEHASSIIVHSYQGTWNDLGTWAALSEQMATFAVGQGIAHECENTHIINELGVPVVALGLKDAVLVATPDGILAADKYAATHLKDVVSPLQNRPMYEERIWGTYRVLDYQKLRDGTEVLTKSIELYPDKNISYQKHMMRSEVWTIIEGHGEVILDTSRFIVGPGDVVRVYADQWHAIRTDNGLKFIEVQRGTELVEEDIVRRYLTWDEIEVALSVGVSKS
ncbi:sugar phosphate nucleotidyltransferase [Alicyclobacillus fastidiosus]|uniref:Sugar phosphate nucleotidyltransferase n=1 Tax=Alicyclobacillus fastidiosus TaxID=392011 RepID=A0ABY6ZFQ9_9BACL|nr:sugar phosphate nucleotidyltransferase [Alicyclobacillus fastidiosus]WAH41687.1 sugar phosphate nucleotidyltransferase [Alicyclobacillus fastidiosus]GMA63366.1 mannose-1-phosphate guanylyltransferase [Alicyclobacillus fastidiosus]